MIRPGSATTFAGLAIAGLLIAAAPGHAGFADALKKKATDRAAKKAEQSVDKGLDKTEKAATTRPATASAEGDAAQAEDAPTASGGAAGGASGDAAKISTVSTKFDFVPGDSVMLYDDFTLDDLGEFPARWKLRTGNFEVVEKDGERWLRCVSVDGYIRMKMPGLKALPEFWTLEFDFFGEEPMGSALSVRGQTKDDRTEWEATFPQGQDLAFRSGEIFSTTPLESPAVVPGRHHVMLMARGKGLKVYIDRQRMASIPDVSEYAGMPAELEFRLRATTQPMITNVRFAQGCRPAKDMLAEGKLVTHGIQFATGSDVVLPESAPVLRQVAAYLVANAAVKLTITGHTDNVGTPANNLDLSKRRAASVAKVLSEQFAVAADRFATTGKGDTQPMAANASPEGRAMNRRVEFARLQGATP